jgi:hopanoid biosynthesis associated protein HpnK
MTKQMIINADDFGLCEGVNKAVAEAHCGGVLTSATLMVNMPAADEAVAFAKKTPTLGVGVHLTITDGKPVSKDAKIDILLGSNGEFKYSPAKLALKTFFNKDVGNAIKTELAAQIQAAIDKGIKPTHLDSHKHFHCFAPIYRIVCSLAADFKIDAIRWPYEPDTVCFGDWPKVGFKDKKRAFIVRQMAMNCQKIDSRFIKTDIFFGLAHTGKIDESFWAEIGKTQFSGVAEVMTHPGYPQGLVNTRLVEERLVELKGLCRPETKQILEQAEIKLVHYGNIDRE